MAEPSKDTDQSMEDILQSIKRIIADEGEPSPASAGSEVLELTDLLAEDAAISDTVAAFEEPRSVGSVSIDEIMAQPSNTPAEPAVLQPAPEASTAPTAPEPASVAPQSDVLHSVNTEGLISEATLAASVSALSALAQKPSPAAPSIHGHAFRSGITVEDLVVESLRPMLKEWLDDNLPALVRSLVEKEIRRLSA